MHSLLTRQREGLRLEPEVTVATLTTLIALRVVRTAHAHDVISGRTTCRAPTNLDMMETAKPRYKNVSKGAVYDVNEKHVFALKAVYINTSTRKLRKCHPTHCCVMFECDP